MHANRQLTRPEVQKLAKDLPRLCLQGPVPTHTVMAMAVEITTLLAERDALLNPPKPKGKAGKLDKGKAKSRHEALIMKKLYWAGDKTCDEMCAHFEWSNPSIPWHSTVSARLHDLEVKGLAVRTKTRKRTRRGGLAHTYTLTQTGQTMVEGWGGRL